MLLTTLEKEILVRFFGSFTEARKTSDEAAIALTHFGAIMEVLNPELCEIARMKAIASRFVAMIHDRHHYPDGSSVPKVVHETVVKDAGNYLGIHCWHFLEAYKFWMSQGGRLPQFD